MDVVPWLRHQQKLSEESASRVSGEGEASERYRSAADEIERLRAALEKAEPTLAAAAYIEQSSPPYQKGRACDALTAVRNALAKRNPEQREPR